MNVPAAIVIAALIIGASIALTSHWSMQPVSGRVSALLLNRWTGEVVWCGFTATTTPSYLDCRPGEWVSVPPKQ
jgi:hypothetical protein